jgi:hypothetical protein
MLSAFGRYNYRILLSQHFPLFLTKERAGERFLIKNLPSIPSLARRGGISPPKLF